MIDNTNTRIIVSLFSKSFITDGGAHNKFKKMNKTRGRVNTKDLDEDFINSLDASIFYEWAKISMAKHVAGYYLTLLKRFRRDTSSCTAYADG